MEVEDQVQPVLLAPREQFVDARETLRMPSVDAGFWLLVGGQGELVEMDRQADRVEAPFRHLRDVRLGRMIVEPGAVELRRPLLADQFDELRADPMLLPDLAELQHIAFLQHPAAESHAAQDHRGAAVVDDLCALNPQPALGLRCGGRKQHRKRQCDPSEFHDGIPIYDL